MILTEKITDLITAQIPNMHLKNIDQQANKLLITTASSQPTSLCPTCGTASSSVHSHYQRGLRDLPAHGASVIWKLHARRFRCRNPTCKQRVFCERYPTGLNARARRTIRLTQTLEHASLTVGASVGARIAQSFKAPVSISTLLRIAHQSESKPSEKPKVIGIDDFAFRRGIHYGTVIVDLERSVVVDVLPDRNADTLKTWLKQHPQLEIISRDRSSEYARAINEGAPQAQQVLDRWHVLKNVREALERFLVRFRKPIAEICKAFEATQIPRNKRTKGEQALRNEAHARRVARFKKVRAALEQDKTIAEIARDLHVSKWFVRCCAKTNEVPELRQNARAHSILDPFVDQLEGLWRSGIRNAKQFWRELHDDGFKGSYKRVHQWVQAKQVQSRFLELVPEATPEITEISDVLVPTKKTGVLIFLCKRQPAKITFQPNDQRTQS